jgi:hypothetical protein
LVFGCALIWLAFSEETAILPPGIKTRIVDNYSHLANKLPDGINPIRRKLLVVSVSGQDNEVHLTELDDDDGAAGKHLTELDDDDGAAGNDNVGGNVGAGGVGPMPPPGADGQMQTYQLLHAVVARQSTLQRGLADLQVQRAQDRAILLLASAASTMLLLASAASTMLLLASAASIDRLTSCLLPVQPMSSALSNG